VSTGPESCDRLGQHTTGPLSDWVHDDLLEYLHPPAPLRVPRPTRFRYWGSLPTFPSLIPSLAALGILRSFAFSRNEDGVCAEQGVYLTIYSLKPRLFPDLISSKLLFVEYLVCTKHLACVLPRIAVHVSPGTDLDCCVPVAGYSIVIWPQFPRL
jgi:hypothetical protein